MPNILYELLNLITFLPAYYLVIVWLHYFIHTEWEDQTRSSFLRSAVSESSQKNVDMKTTWSYQLFDTMGYFTSETSDAFNPVLWDFQFLISQLDHIKLKGLDKLRLTGIFGIVIGLIIGVLAPLYLGLSGRWQVGIMILGSAIFCIIGLSSLISYKIGSIGYGFAILAFAFLSQYSLVIFDSILNSQFFIIKILNLLFLGFALAIFVFVNSESTNLTQEILPDSAIEKKSEMFDRLLKIVGAVLTVMEFINLIASMWRK